MVKTRIAPSPTGYPHIGTIYQALFDWAYAHKHGGKFLVRIEDTDRDRFVEGAEQKIYDALDWFGLTEDISPRKSDDLGPYRQSERLELYQRYAHELVEKGHAYYCTIAPEELEKLRQEKRAQKLAPVINETLRKQQHTKGSVQGSKYVIRMRMPDSETIVVHDEIRGDINFESNLIDDQVILKSDGFPTYHLAVVVDDHLMGITHVLRGEEWINSAPKHVVLYRYFGWEEPKWYHTSLLRNPDKSKMSKRHSHTNVDWYKKEGYLPGAILNYLALMAWSHPEQKEIFDLEEFIRVFDFADMKAVGPAFDLVKLSWMNGEYIRKIPSSKFKVQSETYLKEFNAGAYELVQKNTELFEKSLPLVQERIKKLSEYWELSKFYYVQPTQYEIGMESYKDQLTTTRAKLQDLSEWTAEKIGEKMLEACTELAMKKSEYFMMMRIAITGCKISPPLNESMELLGKDECMERLLTNYNV
jgi:glutamyl-tRNA synthetase